VDEIQHSFNTYSAPHTVLQVNEKPKALEINLCYLLGCQKVVLHRLCRVCMCVCIQIYIYMYICKHTYIHVLSPSQELRLCSWKVSSSLSVTTDRHTHTKE
jgi:hypothetical protein